MSNWGKGSENNNIGWGQAAHTSTSGWGESHKTSYAGLTDIVGDPALSISYPTSALCENASDPTPTVSGNEGSGTFSSTTGLMFLDSGSNTSSSTGVVDISASTAGATYVITYTDTNAATATFSLTINNLDNAAFAYSASSYEPTGSDPTPTITGLSGGTFSSTSGLVFVDSGTNTGSSTGQIDLSATTEATYTITYDTTSSSSSVCPNTSTQSVEVAVAGIANNFSMSFDGVNDYIDLNSLDQSILNGSFTVSFWLNKTAKGGGADNDRMIDLTVSSSTSLQIITDAATNKFGVNFIQSGSSYIYRKVFNNWNTVTGSWHHIALTWDGSSYEYYFDGSSVATTGTSPIGIGGTGFYLGKRADGVASTEFKGGLDEVAIWNTALTSTQISEIYNATGTNTTSDLSTIESSNLKLWLRMGD